MLSPIVLWRPSLGAPLRTLCACVPFQATCPPGMHPVRAITFDFLPLLRRGKVACCMLRTYAAKPRAVSLCGLTRATSRATTPPLLQHPQTCVHMMTCLRHLASRHVPFTCTMIVPVEASASLAAAQESCCCSRTTSCKLVVAPPPAPRYLTSVTAAI